MKKTALVTGGNKGIGLEVTRQLLALGFHVLVIARDFDTFEFKEHTDVSMMVYDLSDVAGIPAMVRTLPDINLLINNAGVMLSIPHCDYTHEQITAIMNLNLYAPIKLIQELSKSMLKRGNCRIVNNASIAGQIGHPDIWYGMSKAALMNATKSLSKLFEGKIIINDVAPSPVDTDMQKVNSKERKEAFKRTVISKRFATASEVAEAIVWLGTKSPEYMNGTCLDINNGSFPR